MFQTTVKAASKIPGLNYIHITGINSKGSVRIGDRISDGKTNCEVTSISFMRRIEGIRPPDEIDICVNPDDFDTDELVGKTLYAI